MGQPYEVLIYDKGKINTSNVIQPSQDFLFVENNDNSQSSLMYTPYGRCGTFCAHFVDNRFDQMLFSDFDSSQLLSNLGFVQ